MPYSLEQVRAMDQQDSLAQNRSLFSIPDNSVYLCGHSLGLAPLQTEQQLLKTFQQWQTLAVKGWNQGWIEAPERLGDLLASVIGARDGEVVICDNLSINLFKLLGYITQSQNDSRRIILIEDLGFPSDAYICQGFSQLAGFEYQTFPIDQLNDRLSAKVSTVVISHVDYRTGQLRDLKKITRQAESVGCEVIWDLAHSAGALPVELNDIRRTFRRRLHL